ncbi:hypothetical protein GP486_001184 [Trichoglossum hirsutum]|uniref:Endo-chitosanase n=1 Tax=Trichoglossum hirsutum TaxID=265104 RepID=A0A9P8LH61_9PEZI|nr:hypothetical protein GP486_001184 [Trichoglossum hirsutum]
MYLALPLLVSALLSSTVSARDVPANVKAFYNKHMSSCGKVLGTQGNFVYCGDVPGLIYLKGTGNQYDNLDVDCDGVDPTAGECANGAGSAQTVTRFVDEVRKFSNGSVKELDAKKIPYVVFGNDQKKNPFDPMQYGMKPLSVMAVVCGDNLVYGIWGDTTGGPMTGEASISLAELCFPNSHISGNSGHEENDVLFIGFTDPKADAGRSYDWKAQTAEAFEECLVPIGDQLIATL